MELDLRDVTLVGFSMGGGEVARYFSKYRSERIHSVVFASAVTPYMLHTGDNPEGTLTKAAAAKMTASLTASEDSFYDGFTTEFFSANGELKVTEAQRQEAERRGNPDLPVCRQQSDAHRGDPHQRQGRHQRGFASDAVPVMAEHECPDRSSGEADREGGEAGEGREGWAHRREEEATEDQRRRLAVDDEVIPFDCAPNHAGPGDPRDGVGFKPLHIVRHLTCSSLQHDVRPAEPARPIAGNRKSPPSRIGGAAAKAPA